MKQNVNMTQYLVRYRSTNAIGHYQAHYIRFKYTLTVISHNPTQNYTNTKYNNSYG